jgi:hypothetical protein
MLIESIYKEISTSTKSSGDCESGNQQQQQSATTSNRSNDEKQQHQNQDQSNKDQSQQQQQQQQQTNEATGSNDLENLLARSSSSTHPLSLLDELKTRKLSTNNWNQKITIELVECKIKLKQLVMEM